MRDRLIELLNEVGNNILQFPTDGFHAALADYLLANGVIVPPVSVGQKVYMPMETDGECEPYVSVGTVFAIRIDEGKIMWISVRCEGGLRYYHTLDDFVKMFCITKEQAEKALAERSKQ